jgi:hypothetical protein
MVELSAVAESDAARRPTEPAIDLTHLSRMTFCDKSLEREVLTLFDRQAELLLGHMRGAAPTAVAAFAHTLKGSARGIGAAGVATAAEDVEGAANRSTHELASAVERLSLEVAVAKSAIAQLLRAN